MTEVTTTEGLPPIPMIVRDGQARVTSREVAEIFGKRHNDVLTRIRDLDCSPGFGLRNFSQSSYMNAQNKPQPMVELTRDGFTFLAMGFTGPRAAQFKEAFIAAFNAMEDQLRGGSVLPVMAQAMTTLQKQVSLLMDRQADTDNKVAAILDLVDVTKRYVALLENSQKTRPRTKPYTPVTHELEAQLHDLFDQGLSVSAVARQLDISRSQAHRIRRGEYSVTLQDKRAGLAPGTPRGVPAPSTPGAA